MKSQISIYYLNLNYVLFFPRKSDSYSCLQNIIIKRSHIATRMLDALYFCLKSALAAASTSSPCHFFKALRNRDKWGFYKILFKFRKITWTFFFFFKTSLLSQLVYFIRVYHLQKSLSSKFLEYFELVLNTLLYFCSLWAVQATVAIAFKKELVARLVAAKFLIVGAQKIQ